MLVVEALVEYAHDQWNVQPCRAARARVLAVEIAATHVLGLEDALRQRAELAFV